MPLALLNLCKQTTADFDTPCPKLVLPIQVPQTNV